MANGKVITGYSKPVVALYDDGNGTPTYTNFMPLARGVSVELDVSAGGEGENFYADNILAESESGSFSEGTATFTIDGLKTAARNLIMGIPDSATSKVTVDGTEIDIIDDDDRMAAPYVGVGFIVRYMEDHKTTYSPVVLTKCRFNMDGLSAETQGETISFQPAEISAVVMRDDSANHRWKRTAKQDVETEAEAEAIIRALLGATA